jgi:hypothetical protein
MAPKIIGIGGYARAGKDTLYGFLRDFLKERYQVDTQRVALADKLKTELAPFLKEMYGIDAFTQDPNEKSLIRPLFVEHGRIRRTLSYGTHWTSAVEDKVNTCILQGIVPVITDIRYNHFPKDEVFWLHHKGGIIIHVTRLDSGGLPLPAPNEEEHIHDVKTKLAADYLVRFPTTDLDTLKGMAYEQFERIFKNEQE